MGPSPEQARLWNEVLAPRMLAIQAWLSAALAPHGLTALDRVAPGVGSAALDVGCGVGDTAIELARRVGPDGSVVGVDLCEPFLAAARAEADRLDVPRLRFLLADAQLHPFAPEFDLCFSRFGTQFFDEPREAFANLRRALAPSGRLCTVVWDALDRNPWLELPWRAARRHLPRPAPSPPGTAGPFSLADPGRLSTLLTTAGFVDVAVEAQELLLPVGGSPAEAAPFLLRFGPAGETVRLAGAEGDRLRARLEDELAASLESHATPAGVRLLSRAWRATGRVAP